MANWIHNRVMIDDADADILEIFDVMTVTDSADHADENMVGRVTFNKLLPMPKCLEGLRVPVNRMKGREYQVIDDEGKFVDSRPATDLELARLKVVRADTGCDDWQDWRRRYWGCIWDAVGDPKAILGEWRLELKFDTPFAPPVKVIEEMRRRWPNASITGFWIEEGNQAAGVFE